MSFYDKIKTIAETMTNYSVVVDSANGANIDFDTLPFPAILIVIQQAGKYNTSNSHYRDSSKVRISVLNKITQGAKSEEIEPIKTALKADLIELYHKIRFNFDFKTIANALDYNVVYDDSDANLLGIIIEDTLTERIGYNLACNTVPQPQTFDVIIKDQDGNVIQTFNTSGQYVVTVLTSIQDTITANTSTIIEPLT